MRGKTVYEKVMYDQTLSLAARGFWAIMASTSLMEFENNEESKNVLEELLERKMIKKHPDGSIELLPYDKLVFSDVCEGYDEECPS